MQVPVFLKRNRRKMKELRKHLERPLGPDEKRPTGHLIVDNGLVMRQVPLIRKLQFDANSGDFMIYKRQKTAEVGDATGATTEE